ncbi:hypothetical protein K402DRAFT_459223 [Aulographum hederae CBS 113979]|uniref:Formin GTPase-binding domain-containing protein n=1 Tax=Aulographum hederae CBS 113979 TaxID=1176131 RepID=A0A6G1HG12_9PEZI|nr:hypothetical protein K402DRAFT_459223 [Aulographum hederae CBS 113979]
MDSTTQPEQPAREGRPHHRRNNSAAVLKSIISRGHKRNPSEGPSLSPTKSHENTRPFDPHATTALPMMPPDHPLSSHRALSEIHNKQNKGPPSPSKAHMPTDERPRLGKKTMSSVSLRSLAKEKEKEKEPKKSRREPSRSRQEKDASGKPKKTKSSNNLAAMFSRSKSKDHDHDHDEKVSKDKENTTPPSSTTENTHAPIWEEFSSRALRERTTTTTVPLNDSSREDEIARYTPQAYSPSKQRNFGGVQMPTLGKNRLSRPPSMHLPKSTSTSSFMDTIARKMSSEKPRPEMFAKPSTTQQSKDRSRPNSRGRDEGHSKTPALSRKNSEEQHSQEAGHVKGVSRVMAAVAALNGKAKGVEEEAKLDPKQIDEAFESVLDSRNIPENMRQKMRTLKTTLKADFIKSHQVEGSQSSKESSNFALWSDTTTQADRVVKPSDDVSDHEEEEPVPAAPASAKRTRPLSNKFTWSKADSSPTKKQKAEMSREEKRASKGAEIHKTPSSKSLSSMGAAAGRSLLSKGTKAATPEDHVAYLRKVTEPCSVEVGRLHKLRLLLRNETVAWVDSFIRLGGMTEIVALLHRIMAVEWREEHEDNLLHESLLCLKGLCTTDLALQQLEQIQTTLFPALLRMLFDDEHKGPSEFTTRGVIMNVIFMHLEAASPAELPGRARTILGYLADPEPEEEKRPIEFVEVMRTRRPYRVWCREVSNVTKEVFWIFLHNLNVVALPEAAKENETGKEKGEVSEEGDGNPTTASTNAATTRMDEPTKDPNTYSTLHFPRPRPPIPAAPYVGGVEWDATNYIATHLDLLNGLIASLPTATSRNQLREELKASGWEKAMGNTLRTCKEKFYSAVHDGLRTWVSAAKEDGWRVKDVRYGVRDDRSVSPVKVKSPKKGEAPKIDVKVGEGEREKGVGGGAGLGLGGLEFERKKGEILRKVGGVAGEGSGDGVGGFEKDFWAS